MTEKNEGGSSPANSATESGNEPIAIPPRQTPIEPHSSAPQKKKYLHKPKDWVGLLTLIAVATYTGITALMWCTSNRQLAAVIESNKINYNSFVSTQRAYMYYAGVNARNTQANGVYTFWIAPTFGNSGNTPTVDLISRANCWTDPEIESDPFEHFRSLKDEWRPGFYGPRVVLNATDCSVSLDEANRTRNGNLRYYLAGEAIYKDSVAHPSPEHTVQFTLEFLIYQVDERGGGLSGTAAQRGRHNCADDSCPK
jgi:hypothetical protein